MNFQKLMDSLKDVEEIEINNFSIDAEEIDLTLNLQSMMPVIEKMAVVHKKKEEAREKIIETKFPEFKNLDFKKVPVGYKSKINAVQIGHTKSEGGTRKSSVMIGGDTHMPYEAGPPVKPIIAFDIFDMRLNLPKAITMHFDEVMDDPAEWAKLCEKKYGAELITFHLVTTDPDLKDRSAREAAKTIEDVLQAISIPMLIGGSGNPDKDPTVLEYAGAAAEGERCMLNSASLNMDYEPIVKAGMKYGHAVLSWTQLDINSQKILNKKMLGLGMKHEDIIMDPTTAPLGYGMDYTYSVMERIRLNALKGDTDLQMPMASGTTNAWGAREAWMKNPEWGDKAKRGVLWEATLALSVYLAGCNVLFMMCPDSMVLFKNMVKLLSDEKRKIKSKDWMAV
ncbi:MAG: CO dehydrogenase/acetyl-CoA synthase subunit delta [Methanosarcinaceae archaeon]|nr:CO dehydrogenase/acetyl-CoA synthase subunit delta [Methanosarcinaceae archaeon]NKQ38076.1 CO dehydrogenase/acetyl-CoA synthase subunit delta [Methanosarcinales archaeon]